MSAPDYAFWDAQEGLTQVQAACLWCKQEPSLKPQDWTAQIHALMSEIHGFLDGRYPNKIPRIVLRALAKQRQQRPLFLYPEDRIAQAPPAAWPWGSHETELLRHLKAAAEHWWVRYDPQDPSTAPTNQAVQDWLVNKRGVSATSAEAIAKILRADGLKTGPR